MITASMIFGVALAAIVWGALWLRTRWRQAKRLHAMDSCECSKSVERAQKMHDSVSRTLAKIDSRQPDYQPAVAAEPETEIEPKRIAVTHVAVVLALGLLWGSFMMGGEVRERSLAARSTSPSRSVPAGRTPVSIHEGNRGVIPTSRQVSELRDKPTLAIVTHFATRQRTDEVVSAMRSAAQSDNEIAARAARVCLLKWKDKQ